MRVIRSAKCMARMSEKCPTSSERRVFCLSVARGTHEQVSLRTTLTLCCGHDASLAQADKYGKRETVHTRLVNNAGRLVRAAVGGRRRGAWTFRHISWSLVASGRYKQSVPGGVERANKASVAAAQIGAFAYEYAGMFKAAVLVL